MPLNDSKTLTVNRIDFCSKKIGSMKRTDEGYLQGEAAIAKTGILTYFLKDGTTRKELVTENTLFDPYSMKSLEMKPITNQHPSELILDSKTVKRRKVGSTGNIILREGDYLLSSIVVMDNDAVGSVENGTQELSPGYECRLSFEPGIFNGESYDAVQINRRYNHVALCDNARGGHNLRLNVDSKILTHCDGMDIVVDDSNNDNNINDSLNKRSRQMPVKKINGIDYEGAQELINHIDSLENQIKQNHVDFQKGKVIVDTLTAEKDSLQEKFDSLSEELPKQITEGVQARLAIEKVAQIVLDDEELKETDSLLNLDLMKKIIQKERPKANLDGKNDTYIQVRFDDIIETLDEKNNSDESSMDKQRRKVMPKHDDKKSNDRYTNLDAEQARKDYINELENRYLMEDKAKSQK